MDTVDYEVICKAASFGIALDLKHRYEWYTNASRALGHGRYTDIPVHQERLDKAFLAFEKTLVSCPEDEIEYAHMTITDFLKRVSAFYNKG